MKIFIKDNPTLAFGLGLPLLLVAIIALVSGLPQLLVPSPQYDVIYATGYSNGSGLQIEVKDHKAVVTFAGETYSILPRLWHYSAESGAVKEIPVRLPQALAQASRNAESKPATLVHVSVPELEKLRLDPSDIAPDGYEFRSGSYGSSQFMTGLFLPSPRYGEVPVLVKEGRSIRLRSNTPYHYYHYNTRLIGWVVPK